MLTDLLQKDTSARKVFGKKEIGIMIKQMNSISLTQSEKNRLSRDIRPKLEFIKRCYEYKDEFGLKKGFMLRGIINESVKVILEDRATPEIKMVLLYGSIVENAVTYRSDIDICVVFDKPVSLREANEFRVRLLGRLPEKVDLQVYEALPFKIRMQILKNSRVLYKAKDFDSFGFILKSFKVINDYFATIHEIEN